MMTYVMTFGARLLGPLMALMAVSIAQAAQGGMGGAGGVGGGGPGGSGGSGSVLQRPGITEEELTRIEKTLSAEQRQWLERICAGELPEYRMGMATSGSREEIKKAMRAQLLTYLSLVPEAERAQMWTKISKALADKRMTSWEVTDVERKQAGAPTALEKKLMVDCFGKDLDLFFEARRAILSSKDTERLRIGLADGALALAEDDPIRIRIKGLLYGIVAAKQQEQTERARIAATEAALSRMNALQKQKSSDSKSNFTFLVSRAVCDDRACLHDDFYNQMCYFSFPGNRHGYKGEVSLGFGNGRDRFDVVMNTGQKSRIKDYSLNESGTAYAQIKRAPNAEVTAIWPQDKEVMAIADHVYVVHHLEGKIDNTFKFRVVEMKSGQWVVIEWEPIPREP